MKEQSNIRAKEQGDFEKGIKKDALTMQPIIDRGTEELTSNL